MHGLNTRQRVDTLTPQTQTMAFGQSQQALSYVMSVDAPGYLASGGMLNGLSVAPETQVYVKRCYGRAIISNNGIFPIMCESYLFKARFDLSNSLTVNGVMSQDGPNITDPYVSPTTGDNFRKTFKILSSRTRILNPGKTYTFKVPSQYSNATKYIMGDIEGNFANFNYRKGNIIRYLRFYGVPVLYGPTPDAVPGTILSSIAVTGIFKGYVSYYTMDDATADSSAVNNLAPSLPNNNTILNAVTATAAFNADPGRWVEPARLVVDS
ncbi:capsid protein [Capybara virus 26_cap1_2125]|nr:capsid protein [Capybara virus 26_cap1_2125]